MLRTLFFLLVLANLLFFVWTQGYLGVPANGREPQRLKSQLAPEKLRVVGSGSAATVMEQGCQLVAGIALTDLERLLAQAKERYPQLRLTLRPNEAPKSVYRVLIPPLGSKPAAQRKSVELKKLDIPDFSIVLGEGPDQFAILLGVFNSELAAGEYLKELAKRGVRSAKVQARGNPLDTTQLEVRGPPDLLGGQLGELLQGQAAARRLECTPAQPP